MEINNKTAQSLIWGAVLMVAIAFFFYELGKDVAQLEKKEPKNVVPSNQ